MLPLHCDHQTSFLCYSRNKIPQQYTLCSSLLSNCYHMKMCSCICICILNYNLLSPYIDISMYVFRDDYLVLDKQILHSCIRKATSPVLKSVASGSVCRAEVQGLFSIHFGLLIGIILMQIIFEHSSW